MRRMIIIIIAVAIALPGFGQKSVDNLFKKYSGSDGYVTLTISGNLLRLAEVFDDDHNTDNDEWPAEITEIRILARENENRDGDNFYDMVIKEVKRDNYEEFMTVKKKDQDLIMLVRAEGRIFKEFLMVAGGEDNLIIQIKGDLTMKDAKKISANFKHDHDLELVSCQE